jgi:ABC-type sugar transport system ATPase subunit
MLAVEELFLEVGGFLRLAGVSLRIAEGEVFVLMGPTGSGKSLLAKCICGLIRPTLGRVEIAGTDVTDAEPRRRRVGYVPQDGALFPHMTVERNLTFAPRVAGEHHASALGEMQGVIEMLSLSPLLERRTDTLSGGERQKVVLARALAAGPRLLVLDEPLSALDEPSRKDVSADLRNVQRRTGIATLHICHNVEEASALADRVGIMHAGHLVQTGTLADLRNGPADEAVARILGV